MTTGLVKSSRYRFKVSDSRVMKMASYWTHEDRSVL